MISQLGKILRRLCENYYYIINIADSQIKILDKLSKKKISRDKIIGQALTSYIASNDHNNKAFRFWTLER